MKYLLRKIKEFINWIIGLFKKSSGIAIYEVLAITPGRMHAWIESSVGRIRKPLGSIPDTILNSYIENEKLKTMPLFLNK